MAALIVVLTEEPMAVLIVVLTEEPMAATPQPPLSLWLTVTLSNLVQPQATPIYMKQS